MVSFSMVKKMQVKVLGIIIFLLAINLAFGENYQRSDHGKAHFSLGLGLGIPYGIAGINLDVTPIFPQNLAKLSDYLSFSMGLGYCPGGLGYAFGLRVYPIKREKRLIPILCAYYGIVGVISYGRDWDRMRGIMGGTGFLFKVTKHLALDCQALYIIHCYDWDTSYLENRVKLTLGIHRQF